MIVALLAAVAAAGCSGLAAVLQAKAVRRDAGRGAPDQPGVHPRLLLRLARSRWYVAGLALVALGFGLSFLALRELPVFVVAVARASSLGVTAALAWPLLGVRLRRSEVAAVMAVVVGLVLLAGAGRPGRPVGVAVSTRYGLLIAVGALVALAVLVGRRGGQRAGVALAAVAGMDFGVVAVAARSLSGAGLADLPTDPAAWALAAAGLHGLLVYASALQRVAVTGATATMVGVETLSGATAGIVLLGDGTRPGWAVIAALGFVAAVGGALVLAGTGAASPAPRPR